MTTTEIRTERGYSPTKFSLGDLGFVLKMLGMFISTTISDMSPGMFKRFFFPSKGNKERVENLGVLVGLNPHIVNHIVHNTEGDYTTLKDGQLFFVRDFDLYLKCCTVLGHRGDFAPAIFAQCFQGASFSSQPERYGQCPYGNWDVYKDIEPHYMSRDRFSEQEPMVRKIVDDYFKSYIGKTVEVGKLLRLLVWNVFNWTTFGVEPSAETERMFQVYEDHLKEWEYVVRMSGARLEYEWSLDLKAQTQQLEDWHQSIFDERVANIDKYKHQSDVLTDTILNHSDIDLKKSLGAMRGVYKGGFSNFHTPLCGAIISNAQNNDSLYNYLMQDPETNIGNVVREALRLYVGTPFNRNVREEDDLVIDGKKLQPGTDVILSTSAINTDPRSWDRPLEFDASRFENTEEIGFLCQRGFVPFGASANIGGRPCAARYYVYNNMKVMLDKILRDYKLTAKRGGFEYRFHSAQITYCGDCHVSVEMR